ncbi:Peptidyl-alpha-hydroxyglycine alpha-amidating lyase 2 [Eumeta japonica]|uniref:peptidylamidoglycolate lyase n=1 Tax=Eumeta variegata TaxID=151549 RepID=A0A4C1T6L9_EUMVA|nr:Peptidyl-alpha-hydroxyglycine alpha-amidating lyase 2 [Eumeta japonica]
MVKAEYVWFACILMSASATSDGMAKRSYSDQTVKGYITERTCWWNEICKEEFQILFRCKCPAWSYCRSPGRDDVSVTHARRVREITHNQYCNIRKSASYRFLDHNILTCKNKMCFLVFVALFTGVLCEPETVRENFDYFSYSSNDDLLKNTDLHMPKDEVVLRPQEIKDWPQQSLNVGQITAVSINSLGQPVIFHRAERIWDESTFNESNVYQNLDKGPIIEDTILVLDPHSGSVLHSWGAYAFYMPHGLTVDHHDNVWVTDVAKHQVFKYTTSNHKYPSLTIGEAFTAGYPHRRRVLLCMPTSVAVASTGEIFIADGYCNNRIVKLNAAGGLLLNIPVSDSLTLNLPHSVALVENLDMVCVADRENMRIVCFKAGLVSLLKLFEPPTVVEDPTLGRVFAVASHGDTLYAVNGPTAQNIAVRGFTVNARYGNILDTWEPSAGFSNPHSLAVTRNGSHLYVTEIGPNKIWKFELTDVYDK